MIYRFLLQRYGKSLKHASKNQIILLATIKFNIELTFERRKQQSKHHFPLYNIYNVRRK